MRGGPLNGRLMAWSGPLMPCIVEGKRVGSYHWIVDYWEYEQEEDNVETEQA